MPDTLTDTAGVSWNFLTALQAKANIASKVFQVADAPSGGDDTASLQTKVDTLAAVGGGTLYIPVGTYLVSNLDPCSNLRIVGAGWASILKQAAAQSIIRVVYTSALRENIILENLAFDGNKSVLTISTGSEGCAVKLERQKGCIVRNCYFYNSVQAGLLLGNPGDATGGQFIVTDNYFLNCSETGSGGWGPIGIVGGDSVLVCRNICENTEAGNNYSIDIEPNTGWINRRIVISNNICLRGSIKTANLSGASTVQDLIISNNYVDSQNMTGAGPSIQAAVTSGSCNISDNLVKAPVSTSAAILVGGTPGRVMITNNTIWGLGSVQNTQPNLVGIYMSNAGIVRSVIKDNHIEADAPTHATTVAGIKFVSGFDTSPASLTVEGNTFKNVVVPFATGIFQPGDVITTANLPVGNAALAGRWCIEDGGTGVAKLVTFVSSQRFKGTLTES